MRFRLPKLIRRWFSACILLSAALGLLICGSAMAQTQDKAIRSATLQLWPEYDDPGLLVIFSGDFAESASFPQEVEFQLPSGARGIQATERQADGQLINQAWQIKNGKLTFTLPGPGFHIEYYLDRPPSGDQREISYSFDAPYAIDSLDIRVQQPARATQFSMIPAAETTVTGDDGLTYSLVSKSNLKPGDGVDLILSYTKVDQGVSQPASASVATSALAEASSQPISGVSAVESTMPWLPWLLIGIGLVALAVAAVYWFARGRSQPSAPPPTADARRARAKEPASFANTSDRTAAYCTQCGRQLRPEDRFCANCGAPR